MTKSELIRVTAKKAGCTQETAAKILEAAIEATKDALISGETITIPHFGKLERRQHKGRTAYTPLTGEIVEMAAKFYAGFIPSRSFKERLNEEAE